MKKIIRKTPKHSNQPVGKYSHITKIPAGMDTYVFSGQIGVDANGNLSDNFNEQVKQLFANIKDLLDHEQMTSENITKVNIWSVDDIDWDFFYEEWDQLFQTEYPSMTIAYISALGLPEIRIEVDVWLAKDNNA